MSVNTFVLLPLFFLLADCETLPEYGADVSNLIAVVQIHRHGQRTPVSFYPNDPYSDASYWPAGPGELTNTGKNQHFDLGQLTRSRYDGFLPRSYSNLDIYAQTTDVDRTHMSAQCNLAGIYRPLAEEIWNEDLNWQPIPVHLSDSYVMSTLPQCPIYYSELANIIVNAEYYADINERYADLYAYLTEKSGTNVTSVFGVSGIWDTLHIEEQFGYELPEWTQSVYPEPLTSLALKAYQAYDYTDLLKKLGVGGWFHTVSNFFHEMSTNSSSNPKYQLYSAHDVNIHAVLETMDAYNHPHPPSFTSTVYLELRDKNQTFVVNVWSKDEEILETVSVRGCDFDCPLEEFDSRLGEYSVSRTHWEGLCELSSSDITDLSEVEGSPEVMREVENVLRHSQDRKHI